MTARTHDLAAVTALGILVLAQPARTVTLGTALIALLANLIGGIAPDIDQPTAPFWRNLPVGGVAGKIIDRLLGGHRFITHSIIGGALLSWLFYWLLKFLQPSAPHLDIHLIWQAFVIGMVSHLIMDTFTKEGVPWLLPIPIKFGLPPLRAWRVTTGKVFETWIIFPALLLFDVYYCWSHYQQILSLLRRHLI